MASMAMMGAVNATKDISVIIVMIMSRRANMELHGLAFTEMDDVIDANRDIMEMTARAISRTVCMGSSMKRLIVISLACVGIVT